MSNDSDNTQNEDVILACAIAKDLGKFPGLIQEMQGVFGDSWGGLDTGDALSVLNSSHAEHMQTVVLVINENGDETLDLTQKIIQTAKSKSIRCVIVTQDISAASLHSLMRMGADDFVPYPLPDGALVQAVSGKRIENPAQQETQPETTAEPVPAQEAASDAAPVSEETDSVSEPEATIPAQTAEAQVEPEPVKQEAPVEVEPTPAPEPVVEPAIAEPEAPEPASEAIAPAPIEPEPVAAAEPEETPEPEIVEEPAVAKKAAPAVAAAAAPVAAAAAAVVAPTEKAEEPEAEADNVAPGPGNAPKAVGFDKKGTVFPVYSMAGGAGGSTFAANLAWELQSVLGTEGRVCLLDFGFQFGSVSTYLDTPKTDAILELYSNVDYVDAEGFTQSLTMYKETLAILPAPPEPVPLDMLSPAQIEKLINLAASQFDYVIIDLPNALLAWTETMLEQAHLVFSLLELDMRSAQNALRYLRALKADELPYEKVQFIMNRAPKKTDMTGRSRVKRMADSLNIEFRWSLPDGGKQIVAACDQGAPLAVSAPRNPVRKEMRKIAENLVSLSEDTGKVKARA